MRIYLLKLSLHCLFFGQVFSQSAAPFKLLKSAKPGIGFIKWDSSSLKKLAPSAGVDIDYAGYARMIQLKDKSLFCVYEISGGFIKAIKSKDRGNS